MTRRVETYDDLDALSRTAAELITGEADKRSPLSIALSGGSTPQRLYELLATDFRRRLDWNGVHLFWADERFVPPGDAESNYGTALRLFIDRVPIPSSNVHPIATEFDDPAAAAKTYDDLLREYFEADAIPATFDVALLGLGSDGHTASLFPGRSVPADRWVAHVLGPSSRPPRDRITLTPSVLNRARRVVFLVAGAEKRGALTRVIASDPALPATWIRGSEETLFLVDAGAAGG